MGGGAAFVFHDPLAPDALPELRHKVGCLRHRVQEQHIKGGTAFLAGKGQLRDIHLYGQAEKRVGKRQKIAEVIPAGVVIHRYELRHGDRFPPCCSYSSPKWVASEWSMASRVSLSGSRSRKKKPLLRKAL